MEFTSNCYWMSLLEAKCKDLAGTGQAEVVKDTARFGYNRRFNTKVYNTYLVHITNPPSVFMSGVAVRFWYDKRNDVAGVKVTHEGLNLLLHSFTITTLLRQLNIRTHNGNKAIDAETIRNLLVRLIEASDKNKTMPKPEINVV